MKRLHPLFFAAAALLLAACGSRNAASLDDFTVAVYTPSHASGFEIVGAEGQRSTILKVFDPWQGAENTETMLFLPRRGASPRRVRRADGRSRSEWYSYLRKTARRR